MSLMERMHCVERLRLLIFGKSIPHIALVLYYSMALQLQPSKLVLNSGVL
jgi:hypothetical protein